MQTIFCGPDKFHRTVGLFTVYVVCIIAILALVCCTTAVAEDLSPCVNQTEAAMEMARLHNAGLLLDLTVAHEPFAGEMSPELSWSFMLEDRWALQPDGYAIFSREGKRAKAVAFVAPRSTLTRLRADYSDRALSLFRGGRLARMARSFASTLVPEILTTDWRVSWVEAPEEGRAEIILSHIGPDIKTVVRLSVQVVKRSESWRFEIVSFSVGRVS